MSAGVEDEPFHENRWKFLFAQFEDYLLEGVHNLRFIRWKGTQISVRAVLISLDTQ